jgi:hypothetical protein
MERTLRAEVTRILDLAEVLGRRLQIAIVDDGSQDGTYEIACELAREFPQVRIMRQPYQRGLGNALEQVRIQLRVDQVVVHDGVAAIDLNDLADVLAAPLAAGMLPHAAPRETASDGRGSRRFAAPKLLNAVPSPMPRPLGAFRWLRLDEPLLPRRSRTAIRMAETSNGDTASSTLGSARAFITSSTLRN